MKTYFAGTGDNPFAEFLKHTSAVSAPTFSGYWAWLELQLDELSPQRFPVGVVVASSDGNLIYQLLSESSKFECVYGKGVKHAVEAILGDAERSLARHARSKTPLPQVAFDNSALSLAGNWPASGASADALLSRLFRQTVAMEPGEESVATSRFQTLDTESVRTLVNAELKRIAGMRFEKIVVQSKHIIPSEGSNVQRVLDFNLLTERGAGTVLSAVYKTQQTAELNLLRGSRDLATYGQLKKMSNLAVFLMLPREAEYGSHEFKRLHNLLDEQVWCLEKQGFRVSAFDEPISIAQDILEWSET
jgi:hypothetical protein